jgi:hypothetical protein
MDDIAGLLFGRGGGGLLDLILGPSREERDAADRTRQSAEWCGSTPGGRPAPGPLGRPLGRPRGPMPRGLDIHDFPGR